MIVKEEFTLDISVKGPTDFEVFARDAGFWLTPVQLELANAIIEGKKLRHFPKQIGKQTVHDLLKAYMGQRSYIGHFKNTHFLAMTAKREKFVYCPVGNICSWSEGDFDNRYCAWCKKFFPTKDARN